MKFKTPVIFILCAVVFTLQIFITAKAAKYETSGDCGGFPKANVKTAPGFCLGVVYEPNQNSIIPQKIRWAVELNKNSYLISDIVSFGGQNGFIYRLDINPDKSPTEQNLTILFSEEKFSHFSPTDQRRKFFYQPNQILKWKDNKIYVGTTTAIFRFDPYSSNPVETLELIIDNIPYGGLHSLKSLTFDNEGNIYVNVGSDSNVCQNFTKFADTNEKNNPLNHKQKQFDNCPEAEDQLKGRGQIRKYLRKSDSSYSKDFIVYAKGLRNSIALVWDPIQNFLIQGENSRDAITKFASELSNSNSPEDELNIIFEGNHYGWPYCYSSQLHSPEWTNVDCTKDFTPAQILLPTHSAPLSFIIYQGSMFPEHYKGKLIGSLHGYESKGHRIVTFDNDNNGKPVGTPLSLVYDWEYKGTQGKGKPVGLTELKDGSVLIVEDDPQNSIVRLFYDRSKNQDGKPIDEINLPPPVDNELSLEQEEIRRNRLNQKTFDGNLPPFIEFEIKVIDKYCYVCHQTAGAPGIRFLRYDDEGNLSRIVKEQKAQLILNSLKGTDGTIPMPMSGWESEEEKESAIKIFQTWIDNK